MTDETNEDNGPDKNVINSRFFKYKTSITGSNSNVATAEGYDANKGGIKKVEIAVPLKYLINFSRTLDVPLINCELSLTLNSSENCVITSLEKKY